MVVVYFIYTFLAFYFLMIYLLTYLQNKKQIYEVIEPKRNYEVSVVIPCWNEAKTIGKTIEGYLKADYSGLKKIIVVDDCSTDNSYKIMKRYEKKYAQVLAVQTPKNTGRAAGAKNFGAKFVKTEMIAFSDADSFPRKDAMSKMVGFFNDPKVGAVTSRVLVKNKTNKLAKAQGIEYKVIALTRKLLGFLESIYVTNGPLSIYRLKGFKQVGGFNFDNWTEDIELTWNFVAHGWKVEMAIPAKVYTHVPDTIKTWFKQRIRWNVGGVQTVFAYFPKIARAGMLGRFIIPFFVLSWFIGLTGLVLLGYRAVNYAISRYLITKYSVAAEVALLQLNEFKFNPTILFFFGMLLFALGLIYLFLALYHSKEKNLPRTGISDIFIYSILYLLMYPPILIYSFYKAMRGMKQWR